MFRSELGSVDRPKKVNRVILEGSHHGEKERSGIKVPEGEAGQSRPHF